MSKVGPLMRVLIYTFGTQGDIQPYVALARGLTLAGHEAVVCTAEGFRGLVEAHGVDFVHMGDEMLELIQGAMPAMRGPRDVGQLVRSDDGGDAVHPWRTSGLRPSRWSRR